MTSARWCPICHGAKEPSREICMACAITRSVEGEHDDPCVCGPYDRCRKQREKRAQAQATKPAALRELYRAYND